MNKGALRGGQQVTYNTVLTGHFLRFHVCSSKSDFRWNGPFITNSLETKPKTNIHRRHIHFSNRKVEVRAPINPILTFQSFNHPEGKVSFPKCEFLLG